MEINSIFSTCRLWKLRNMEIWIFNYSLFFVFLLLFFFFLFFFFLTFLNTCLFLFYKVLCLSSDCLWLRLVHRHRPNARPFTWLTLVQILQIYIYIYIYSLSLYIYSLSSRSSFLELCNACLSIHFKASVAQISLGPWKFIQDMVSSSQWGLIMAPGQETNDHNLGTFFNLLDNNGMLRVLISLASTKWF